MDSGPLPGDTSLPILKKDATCFSPATLAIHADDPLNDSNDVAPALHVATTYRYPHDADQLIPSESQEALGDPLTPAPSSKHVYSRESAPNTSRLESILTSLLSGPSLTYSSGLSAFHALLVHLHPRVVAIGGGYHGCHGVLSIYRKLTGCTVVNLHDTATWSGTGYDGQGYTLGKGDLVHLETPLNPSGVAFDLEHFARLAHERGAWLSVDATFAPPPLLDPFAWGADYVMHSGTKYFGGHSDMLCGVLAVGTKRRAQEEWRKAYWELFEERLFLGAVMGSLEGWLGVRSLRTLELRVVRQSRNATEIVRWLHNLLNDQVAAETTSTGVSNDDKDLTTTEAAAAAKKNVWKLEHASLQAQELETTQGKDNWLARQMPNGFGPVFGLYLTDKDLARNLPSKLKLFHHATSLGGVESLIEWRRMSDHEVDERLLRVSVGIEDVSDLKSDLLQGLQALLD